MDRFLLLVPKGRFTAYAYGNTSLTLVKCKNRSVSVGQMILTIGIIIKGEALKIKLKYLNYN